MDRIADASGFERSVMEGNGFLHVVYRNSPLQQSDTLHIYLDGDGSPWIQERWVSRDPTPRNPLALHLMATDPSPAAYIGRPCYNALDNQPRCEPRYWTSARYSADVADSIASVVTALLQNPGLDGVVLIGYSGGGTLAMLVAERVPHTAGVVTVAGNLDTTAWTLYHQYSPLHESLNPAERPPLPARIFQIHLAGAGDTRIPPSLLQAAIRKQHQTSTQFDVIETFDHVCCWMEKWPEILTMIMNGGKMPPETER